MKVLITGGAGFIGSHLCDKLIAEGSDVICVDNMITGREANIAHLIDNPRFKLIENDVSSEIGVKDDIDWILHLASPASPIAYMEHPIATLRAGSLGTLNCLETAKQCGASFLLASTSEIYGDPLESPQREGYWGNVNSIGPRSVYDEAKRFGEAATMGYNRHYGIDTRIIRIFNTYGPRMRADDGRAVPTFIKQAFDGEDITVFGDGSQTRSFCFVSDMVDGIYRMLGCGETTPINLGNPDEITVLQLAEEIISLTGSKSAITHRPLPTDDPQIRRPDITKAKKALGWEPKINRREGLTLTIDYFRRSTRE